jgi:hypothetical protein
MPDRDEHALQRTIFRAAIFHVAQAHAGANAHHLGRSPADEHVG